MKEIGVFILSFLMIFIIYEVFIVRKAKKKNFKGQIIEVALLVNYYHLDLKKIKYKRLLNIVSLVSSFDIALIVSLIMIVDNYFLRILVAVVATIPILLLSYMLVGKLYKMKGLVRK